jgi:hypothetical protein
MRPDGHEIYGRRRSRNLGLGLTLGAFVLLVFAVTVVKLGQGQDLRSVDQKMLGVQLPAGTGG